MFLKINEPQDSRPKAVGIDLGTTHSLIAVSQGKSVNVLKQHGQTLVPSVVKYNRDGSVLVGKKALERFEHDPSNTIRSVKRYMGKAIADIRSSTYNLIDHQGMLSFETHQGPKTPVEVSASLLSSLFDRAHEQLSGSIQGAVITVPAYFDEAQRLATKQAAQLAGIDVLRLINEPTAASIAYGLEEKANGLCLVYDLGGGTFDVTLLKINQGVFHVLATGGDTALGGDDFDHQIATWLVEHHGDRDNFAQALLWAKQAKELLSDLEEVCLAWAQKEVTLSRSTFHALTQALVDKTINLTQQVLEDAKISAADLSEIICVGGSTKMPLIRSMLKQSFGKEVLCTLDPEQVVVQGAARHAANLLGLSEKTSLLIDVNPLSLGIETMGGVVEKVILRNTPIPAIAKQSFTTYENNQTGMIFHIVQGERELAKDNRSLATFTLKGIPPLPKGHAKIEVTFEVNEENLLKVTSKELTTGQTAQIDVKPSFGLSDETVSQMLAQALEFAEDDLKNRQLEIKRVEGQQLFDAISQALDKDSHLADETTILDIKQKLNDLEQKLKENQSRELSRAIEQLEQSSDNFMRTRLDNALKGIVQGKSLQQMNDVLCRK